MGLTLEIEQRLEAVGLVQFYEDESDTWIQAAQKAYNYVRDGFPENSTIRRDDVSKALEPVVEVHEKLKLKLEELKLREKHWFSRFVDLIIDRTWDRLQEVKS